jgi:hypothetical protein
MSNEYLTYVEEDAKLHALLEDKLPELRQLNPFQIERLIFYLKSLHSYYPKSENHVAYLSEFSEKLEKIRNSAEQVRLQRQAGSAAIKGMLCCIFAGGLLVVGIALLLGSQTAAAIGSLAVAAAFVGYADIRLFRKVMLLSKQQDRKYFLESIRAAKACNELDWAGLFAYNSALKSGPLSDSDLAQVDAEVGKLSTQLRAALYNDEYFQYSLSELRADARRGG